MVAAESAAGPRPGPKLPPPTSNHRMYPSRVLATTLKPANSAPTAIVPALSVRTVGAKSAGSLLDKPGQVSNKDFRLNQSGKPDEAVDQSALRRARRL